MQNQLRERNARCSEWEKFFRKPFLHSYPVRIQLPTGTRCNLACMFCTDRRGDNKQLYSYNDLSFDEFITVFNHKDWKEALSSTTILGLYGWGEPLVNPDYENIFDYVTNQFPGLRISISTNGLLFNEKWCKKITEIDKSEVNFSLNAATKETYRKLMGSNKFDEVLKNIATLTNLCKKSKNKTTYTSLSYVATTENIKELVLFVDLAAELGVNTIMVQDVMIFNEETEGLSLTNDPDTAHKYFQLAKQQSQKKGIHIDLVSFEPAQDDYAPGSDWQSFGGVTDRQDNNSCHTEDKQHFHVPSPFLKETDCFDPWESFMINAEGDVFPCCRFQNLEGMSLGNIYESSFQEIWNGTRFRTFRKTINSDNPPKICAICPVKHLSQQHLGG